MFILFCDIDGTITNKHTHSFEGADTYIRDLNRRGISIILSSSKTFSEIFHMQKELGISQIFIFENGSAIAIPMNGFLPIDNELKHFQQDNFIIYPLVPDNLYISTWAQQINHLYNGKFITITSGDPVKLTSITGLNFETLKMAQQRKYSETYLFPEDENISIDQINELLKIKDGHAEEGSRFITVTHCSVCKGNAVKRIVQLYKKMQINVTTASIGDGKNDFSMFEETDFCYFLTDNNIKINPTLNCSIITPPGPQGFIKACDMLFKNKPFIT